MADLAIDTFHLFSFENYYNQNVSAYFKNVGVRGNYYDLAKNIEFTPWLEYFAAGILDELLSLRKILGTKAKQPADVLIKSQKQLLELIGEKGFAQDKDYAAITKRAKATRTLNFKKLLEMDLIERQGKGPSTFYVLKKKD